MSLRYLMLALILLISLPHNLHRQCPNELVPYNSGTCLEDFILPAHFSDVIND